MIQPRLFLCNGAALTSESASLIENRKVVKLNSNAEEKNDNVYIQLENLTRVFLEHLSPRLTDLLEIASYVYTADCATRRGSQWSKHQSEAWSRDFKFIIPVRDSDFWNLEEVQRNLIQILNFLSNDQYSFEFPRLEKERPKQPYLQFTDMDQWPFQGVERVLMFSGGLDSLAGAIDTACKGEKLVLVSHRSAPVMYRRQRELFDKMDKLFPNRMLHIPVWINKDKLLGREHTQRTRSFLYSALGAIVAHSVEAKGVRFFENGIVSLNLPVADEVLRARASRTTHPQVLTLFSRLYSLVLERELAVDNPFLFKTKTEVVSLIAENGKGHLIASTCSCAHSFFKSKTQWHCGTCSQCIDRRIAVIAAEQEENDPATDYVSDVFIGPRKEGYEQNMAVDYVRHAMELHNMSEAEISESFGLEIPRAIRYEEDRTTAAKQLIDIHKRHGEAVASVLEAQLKKNLRELLAGKIEHTSLLAMIAGQQHLTSSWRRFAERIASILADGIPVACKSKKPDNEPHLQEICDGILRSQHADLTREFPFMRWSASGTKPDWSIEELSLWIELKYVRARRDIRTITEDIAADITKYGDNQRRTLFIIYDPYHLIVDDREFSHQIENHKGMLVRFVR